MDIIISAYSQMLPMLFMLFIFGSITGSFLNVCIWRMPRNESVIMPRSHCVHCQKLIPWYDNIPFLSYLFLGGRCRYCKTVISLRYFLVEWITALTFIVTYLKFGPGAEFFIFTLLLCGLIVATFVDFAHQIIPDEITLGGIAVGLLISFIYPTLHSQTKHLGGLGLSLLGMLVGGVSIYAIGKFGEFMFKKESMGGGDVKFLAMIGAFLGWKKVLLIFFISPIFGAAVGIVMKLKYKKEIIPYGPYLSLGTLLVIFWGEKILSRLFF